ncbi:TonB-dependent receptor [Methylomonas sp. LW13]|uniref:TonB-dependent siderophore receptor n=1 Tax=unclassified Methylomonas TaxID=2608980 RepID=UPI00051B6CD8|nr:MULTISPECIES: TonB-dependent receptor [unclassified Methylomonas]PKD37962.1 TonB-dependent siderophore receptor [Methylomonas sp. Kb3]QBC28286.1 TonB-dependent receptor [Methylomonas sp. LW13]
MSNAKHCNPTAGKGRRHAAKAALLAALISQTAHGDAAGKHHFDIPAQSLNQALLMFGRQSQQQLMYGTDIADNLRSRNLQGDYTANEAIRILLGDAPLQAVTTGEGAITLQPRAAELHNNLGPQTMPAVQVVGKAAYDSTDPYNPDYRLPNASTATKTDTPIMETPYSVAVVPQQVLKDQQVIRVEEAVQNVAGVKANFTSGGLFDVFSMRGFQYTNLYRDGFLLPEGQGASDARLQTANVERIEVLKGPGSILFGRNEPGGIINLVTKRPQATPYHSIQQQFGSYDFYRTAVDSTGTISSDNSLLYRVNLSYENANSFRDFVKTDTVFFAPSLTWNISDKTQANLDINYQHFDDTTDSGIPVVGNRPAAVPINRQIADPFNNSNIGDRTLVSANWSHAFNDNWKLSHRFGAEFFDAAQNFTFFFGKVGSDGNLANLPSSASAGRGFNNGQSHQQEYYTTLNLTGKFNTAMLEHSMLWGFDYFVIDNGGGVNACCDVPGGSNFNIYNPSYLTSAPTFSYSPTPRRNQEWYGLYIQDQIKLPFNLYGNVGLRYDHAISRNETRNLTNAEDSRVSPRGGLLWRPIQWLSVYGNYSENFGPSNTLFFRAPNQPALPPQTAEEWELGAKTEFLDGRLSVSFAYFDLTRRNMSVVDPSNPNISRAIGEQQTRGYEFETSGEILPGWRVIGAYTHMPYANINEDGAFGNTGNRISNTPRNFGSLWNTYEFQNAALRGLKIGGGVVAADQSQGRNLNDFQLPGYATVNLLASYGLNVGKSKVTLQLNANNLLDKTYYTGTNGDTRIGIGTPRSFLGSVKVEF